MSPPTQPAADSSEDSSPSGAEDRNPVEILADQFAHQIRMGETPSIEDYVQKHPDLENGIRSVFPAIARMEKASRQQLSRSGSPAAIQRVDLNLEKIGDFEIVRQLGQGGMGIVYEAVQLSLQRNVALKVISPAISNSPRQLARFKREAATAARLHHTNIVPVFGSGEEGGIYYYAMQLIDGIPLHEAVKNLRHSKSFDFESTVSTYFSRTDPQLLHESTRSETAAKPPEQDSDSPGTSAESEAMALEKLPVHSDKQKEHYRKRVCECIADIADALEYAHEQGVMHRDIKPSNLLMDQQGTVWVTDFGLAKFDENDGITKTGDMVGTLRYMSPEQFSGGGDARSDICSLGLTLFEMLVLQPAYSETRSAPLMKLKTEQAPPSPRRIDPSLPRDLDTIVLKACAVDPKHRYQTAGQFRDDLICYIDGRPISARRIHLAEQAWRWSKRNPLIASLASLSIALLIAVAVVALVGNQTTRAALTAKQIEFERAEKSKTNAENALAEAKKQRQLAESNFSGAVRAFEEIMANISRRGIPHGIAVEVEDEEVRSFETSLTNSDIEVLETLLGFFAEFAEQNRADLSSQSSQAQLRVAEILQSLGRLAESETAFEEAIHSFAKLGEDKISGDENRLIRMRILNELSYCANRRGDFEKAEKAISDCKDLFDSIQQKSPAIQLEFARSLNLFTSMYTRVGYVINRQVIAKTQQPTAGKGNPAEKKTRKPYPRRKKVFVAINNRDAGKKNLVRRANEKAIELLLGLIERAPENSTYQLELSRAYQDRVRIHRTSKDQRIAASSFEKAKRILEELVEKHPNNPAYRFELADFLCNLERTRNSPTNPVTAARVARELVEKWPTVSEYQALYANAQARGTIQRLSVSPVNRKKLEESVNIYRELVAKYPAYYAYKVNFSQYLVILAAQYTLSDDTEKSMAFLQEAEDCLLSITEDGEDDVLVQRIFAELNLARKAAGQPLQDRPEKQDDP